MPKKAPIGRLTGWTNRIIDAAYMLAVLGATEVDMATAFNVSVPTIKYWKNRHPEFKKAIDDGTYGLVSGLAQSLAKRGLGYEYDEEIATFDRSSHSWVKTTKRTHVPPDSWAAARILELKARNYNWSVTQQININTVNTNIDINYNELTTEQLLVLKEISQQKQLPQNAGDENI
jgi:hypothetical protein